MGHEKVCTSKKFCGIVLLSPKDILKFDQYLISGKTACIIYAYLESLVKTIDKCKNYPERSSATKIGEDIPCWYSMSTIWAFDNIENKHSVYRGENFVFP